MFTAAAVRASVYFKRLYIAILLFGLCPYLAQLPSVVADIIMLIFKYHSLHVVILSDLFFISTCLPFFMVLQFYVTGDPVLLQIQQILFAAVTTVSCSLFRKCPKRSLMFFEYWDQGIIICAVVADIAVDNEVVLYCNLYIVSRFQLAIEHVVLLHAHKGSFQIRFGITVAVFFP